MDGRKNERFKEGLDESTNHCCIGKWSSADCYCFPTLLARKGGNRELLFKFSLLFFPVSQVSQKMVRPSLQGRRTGLVFCVLACRVVATLRIPDVSCLILLWKKERSFLRAC